MTKKGLKKGRKNLTWVTAYVVKKLFANFATFRKKICDFSLRPCGSTVDYSQKNDTSCKQYMYQKQHFIISQRAMSHQAFPSSLSLR